MQSSFCFPAPPDSESRLFNPRLAGGALLDIGVYNVAMTRWALASALGEVPIVTSRTVLATLAATGVDQSVLAQLAYADGSSAQMICAFDRLADNALVLHGSEAAIEIPDGFWHATRARLVRRGQADIRLEAPHAVNGFEYQIAEAMRCIRAGIIESPMMPHAETLAVAAELDQLLALAGVHYDF